VQRPGLYFPFIHIRDDDWLKAAALYWPSVRRLVPRGYPKHDSPTAQTFFDAAILRDEVPDSLIDSTAWDLLRILKQNADLLIRDYSIGRAYEDWDGRVWGTHSVHEREPELGWIHVTKFPPHVVDYLSSKGLARHGRAESSDPWIGLHPVLAGAYMTVLAGRLSERAHFEPLTDQVDLRIATPSNDVQAAMNLLLGRSQARQEAAEGGAAAGVAAYVMLAVQYARPKNLNTIPADEIVQCRELLGEELQTFRNYVDSQRAELAELASIPIQSRRLESFAEHVQHTVQEPLQQLEKGLRLQKLEPTRSLLLAGSVAPPLAVSATLEAIGMTPQAVTTAGALAAIGSAWWQVETIRRHTRASSPVGYLLDVRDLLTPKTLTARVRRILQGTYGQG
jgi:Family of unknown function (DUF6236)